MIFLFVDSRIKALDCVGLGGCLTGNKCITAYTMFLRVSKQENVLKISKQGNKMLRLTIKMALPSRTCDSHTKMEVKKIRKVYRVL